MEASWHSSTPKSFRRHVSGHLFHVCAYTAHGMAPPFTVGVLSPSFTIASFPLPLSTFQRAWKTTSSTSPFALPPPFTSAS